MMALEISKKAQTDLQNIWFYTFENFGKLQADRYISLFSKEFNLLCKFPNIGKSQEHLVSGYKRVIVQSHLIFYYVHKNSVIRIVRILHQSMDLKQDIFI
jgi:toxin ParE1/3/4